LLQAWRLQRHHAIVGVSDAGIRGPHDERHGGRDAVLDCDRRDGTPDWYRRAPSDIADFHQLPGRHSPYRGISLERGELITGVTTAQARGRRGRSIRKDARPLLVCVRDGLDAAIVQRDGSGRVALGGVGPSHGAWKAVARAAAGREAVAGGGARRRRAHRSRQRGQVPLV